MTTLGESRRALIAGVERTAMVGRYVAYVILVPLVFAGRIESSQLELSLVTAVVLAHNLFVHYVLATGRIHWFYTRLNLAAHLFEGVVVLLVTGSAESPAFVVFILIVVGYSAYSRRKRDILIVTLLCVVVYGGAALATELAHGARPRPGTVAAEIIAISLAGWIVGSVADLLGRIELGYTAQSRAMASSEAMLRTVLDSAADPILIYDESEFITEVNQAACVALGREANQIIGKRLRAFLFDDGTLAEKLALVRSRGKGVSEETLLGPEGEERQVELHVRSFLRDSQRLFVTVARDVTARRELHEAERQAARKLARLNAELNQVNALKVSFHAAMAQHMRSPLSALLGYLDMLLDEELGETTPGQRRALQTCRRCALRILKHMDDTLRTDNARAEAGAGAPAPEPQEASTPDVAAPPQD